jgi:hypothetical protein
MATSVTSPETSVDSTSNMDVLKKQINTNLPITGKVGRALETEAAGAALKGAADSAVDSKRTSLIAPIEEKYGQRIQDTQKQVSDIGQQLTKPFEVPKETVADFGALGGLVAIMGVYLGSSGKQSANNVLASMTGIVSGYKKGRADLVQQAFKEFDTNMKRLQALSTNATAQLDLYTKLSASDKEKANLVLEQFKAETYGSIAAEMSKSGNVFKAMTAENELTRLSQSASQHADKIKREDERFKQTQEFQREQKELDRRTKRENIVMQLESRAQTSGGAANARYAYNIAESFGQSAVDLLNVTRMPAGTVMGTFAGMTGQSGEGIVSSLTNTLARKITKDDARMMQQVVSGLEMNMARALGGGYASSSAKHMVDAYKQQIPKDGDSPVNMALFLARVKQELDVLAKTFYKHPGANEGYVNQMNDYMKELNAAIPFDVPAVLEAARRSRQSVSERFGGPATEPVRVPPLQATNPNGLPAPVTSGTSGAPKTMPTDERLNAYVAAHPEFGGDINKAKEFLRTQGYK